MRPEDPKVHDVFQILPEHDTDGSRAGWVGAFVLATEIKSWGIQGFVHLIPSHNEGGRAYIRLKWEDIERVGHTNLVPADEVEDDSAE